MSTREVAVERCGGCGQWVEADTACGVCAVDTCGGCDHPVEWHGRFGCRGWRYADPLIPSSVHPCRCTLDDLEAVRRDS